MINKKNKTFRVLAWFGAIVFALALAIMPFMLKSNVRTDIVLADSVDSEYHYESSDVIVPVTFYNSSSDSGFLDTNNIANNVLCLLNYSFNTSDMTCNLVLNDLANGLGLFRATFSFVPDGWVSGRIRPYPSLGSNVCSYYFYNFESGFNANVVSISFGVVPNTTFGGQSGLNELKFVFTDVNSKHLTFILPFDTRANQTLRPIPYRTYYIINQFTDNQFYSQGYSDGVNSGYTDGVADGYNTGYSDGYSVGERTGFNDGVLNANDYSFLGLFGAIVDAPLQAFTGLFDFDISFDGVHNFNLKGFFLAILTIAIVVAIIRFALSK